ncbi:MAG TPA: hypothetical protein VNQ52_03600 [Microbacteriaceae bacterium]|nr:hypothetical protein [Microbacteriaceae bacterium]
MSQQSRATVVRWPVPIALAIPALAATIVITFTPGHTVWFGFAVFAGFALLTAGASGVGIALLPSGAARAGAIAKTVVAALAGVVALVLLGFSIVTPAIGSVGDTVDVWAARALALSLTIAGTLAAFAAIDLIVGIRQRGADRFARDWITNGIVAGLAAIAIVAVPPTFYQGFSFTEKTGELISGAVTSSTMVIGLFGAAAAILGILLAIAGVGLMPERARRERAAA